MSKSSTSVIDGGKGVGGKGSEPDFEPFYAGVTLLKFGRSGKPKERVLYLSRSPANRFLSWRSSYFSKKFGRVSEIDLQSVVEGDSLRRGQTTAQFQKHEQYFGEPGIVKNSFSLMYFKDGVLRSLNIAAPNPQVFKYVFSVLKNVLEKTALMRKTLPVERMFFKKKFEDADTDRSGLLSKNEIFSLLPSMNIEMSKFEVRKLFAERDVDHSGQLDFIEFCSFMEHLRRRFDLESVWSCAISGSSMKLNKLEIGTIGSTPTSINESLSDEAFLEFWNTTQRERINIAELRRRVILAKSNEIPSATEIATKITEPVTINYATFRGLLNATRNELYDINRTDVEDDLDLPLSDYFIASSHNTYLDGDQLWSSSSIGRYIHDLSLGCRCVELDCWDGDSGEPIIYHGYTATGRIKFKDVITAIKRSAFQNSVMPVILSLESHCSYEQQGIMAAMMKSIFGDSSILFPNRQARALPTPNELRNMFIIKAKRAEGGSLKREDSETDDVEEEELDTFGLDGVKKSRETVNKQPVMKTNTHRKASDTHGGKLHPDLAAITFLAGNKMHSLVKDVSDSTPVDFISSYGENKVVKYGKDGTVLNQWIDHNKNHLSRTYPAGSRIDSSNYDPCLGWRGGAQIVALNYQTGDLNMQINMGKFRSSKQCGYVLKPMRLLSTRGKEKAARYHTAKANKTWNDVFWGPACANAYPIRLTINVISGNSLPKPNGSSKGEIIDPYIEIIINGHETDRAKHNSSTVDNNGFNPIWNEVFKYDIVRPDVAMLTLRCMDSDLDFDDFIASTSIPVTCLRNGFRTVQLYNQFGQKGGDFQFASLFVHVSIQPLTDAA
jgi:phosphatidylinositol phospholipase C, delta